MPSSGLKIIQDDILKAREGNKRRSDSCSLEIRCSSTGIFALDLLPGQIFVSRTSNFHGATLYYLNRAVTILKI